MTLFLIFSLVASLIVLLVFFHGQAGTGIFPIRPLATILIALIIGYITLTAIGDWTIAAAATVSAGAAFCYGPQIGWSTPVFWTQLLKGAWLTLSLFPIGLAYAVLRPLAYWIGYTKFTKTSDQSDEVARICSGVFLALTCLCAYLRDGQIIHYAVNAFASR